MGARKNGSSPSHTGYFSPCLPFTPALSKISRCLQAGPPCVGQSRVSKEQSRASKEQWSRSGGTKIKIAILYGSYPHTVVTHIVCLTATVAPLITLPISTAVVTPHTLIIHSVSLSHLTPCESLQQRLQPTERSPRPAVGGSEPGCVRV